MCAWEEAMLQDTWPKN